MDKRKIEEAIKNTNMYIDAAYNNYLESTSQLLLIISEISNIICVILICLNNNEN